MRRIFVYGSLRRGEFNHDRFKGFGDTLIATGTVAGALLKNLGPYPAIIASSNDLDRVVGEVYEIPDDLAEVIDRFERDAGFEARPVTVVASTSLGTGPSTSLGTGDESGEVPTRIEAEAYFFAHPDRLDRYETVEGGDWAKHDHLRLPS